MKGAYILLMELARPATIRVGRLGVIDFEPGYYAYVGSAMNSLEARVARHARKEKKMHWHIDYLLEEARLIEAVCMESDERRECAIAGRLAARFPSIAGFGCSDCRCKSHLFYSGSLDDLKEETDNLTKV